MSFDKRIYNYIKDDDIINNKDDYQYNLGRVKKTQEITLKNLFKITENGIYRPIPFNISKYLVFLAILLIGYSLNFICNSQMRNLINKNIKYSYNDFLVILELSIFIFIFGNYNEILYYKKNILFLVIPMYIIIILCGFTANDIFRRLEGHFIKDENKNNDVVFGTVITIFFIFLSLIYLYIVSIFIFKHRKPNFLVISFLIIVLTILLPFIFDYEHKFVKIWFLGFIFSLFPRLNNKFLIILAGIFLGFFIYGLSLGSYFKCSYNLIDKFNCSGCYDCFSFYHSLFHNTNKS